MAPRYLNVSDLPAAQASSRAAASASAQRPRPSSTPRGRAVEVAAGGSSGRGRAHRGDPTYSITSTPESHSADMGRRMVVYGIQMLLRVICLIAFVLVDHWVLRIVCGLGIIVLPWSAVLLANVGADRSERSSSYLGPEHAQGPAALTTGPDPSETTFDGRARRAGAAPRSSAQRGADWSSTDRRSSAPGDTVEGEVVDDSVPPHAADTAGGRPAA